MKTIAMPRESESPKPPAARRSMDGREADTNLAQFQNMADTSPAALQSAQLQTTAAMAPIQRALAGDLEKINQLYLRRFEDRYPALKSYSARCAVLEGLRTVPARLGSDDALLAALPGVLAEAELDPTKAADTGTSDTAESTVDPPTEPKLTGAPPPSSAPSEPVVLSRAPAKAGPSRRLSPVKLDPTTVEASRDAERVAALYEAGLLLVTAVQRKDLASMHDARANANVASHVDGKQIRASDDDLKTTGALGFAKVNWTLTSPAMRPHYFKMITDKDDRSPKAETGSPVNAPRVATLADPTAMGPRFMRGKEGRADLSEWKVDQSSGKTAGVTDGAPLFDYRDDAVVAERLAEIKSEQEDGYLETNPEINTFGFPPDAVVGFLVTSGGDLDMTALTAAKAAMSAEQSTRSFPIFTWEAVGPRLWRLVLLGYV